MLATGPITGVIVMTLLNARLVSRVGPLWMLGLGALFAGIAALGLVIAAAGAGAVLCYGWLRFNMAASSSRFPELAP